MVTSDQRQFGIHCNQILIKYPSRHCTSHFCICVFRMNKLIPFYQKLLWTRIQTNQMNLRDLTKQTQTSSFNLHKNSWTLTEHHQIFAIFDKIHRVCDHEDFATFFIKRIKNPTSSKSEITGVTK